MGERDHRPADAIRRDVEEILRRADGSEAPIGAASAGTGAGAVRGALDRELREVRAAILRMGLLVEQSIRSAVDALARHDAAAAEAVIHGDRSVNEMQREIASLITATIATQGPVARDLRFLLALDHVTYELERIGDHAGSVAKQARKLAPFPPIPGAVLVEEMGELAARILHDILRALVDVDAAAAREVAARDDEIDHRYHRLFDEMVASMRGDPELVEPGTRLIFAAHYVERIGDRVTNIAEDVVFLETGQAEDLNQ